MLAPLWGQTKRIIAAQTEADAVERRIRHDRRDVEDCSLEIESPASVKDLLGRDRRIGATSRVDDQSSPAKSAAFLRCRDFAEH